jgi:hypothetical protein
MDPRSSFWILKCLSCCKRRRIIVAAIHLLDLRDKDDQPLLPTNHELPKTNRKHGRIAAFITLALLLACIVPYGQTCTYTKAFTAQEKQCFQTQIVRNCRFEETTVLDLLPKGQDICLLLNIVNSPYSDTPD